MCSIVCDVRRTVWGNNCNAIVKRWVMIQNHRRRSRKSQNRYQVRVCRSRTSAQWKSQVFWIVSVACWNVVANVKEYIKEVVHLLIFRLIYTPYTLLTFTRKAVLVSDRDLGIHPKWNLGIATMRCWKHHWRTCHSLRTEGKICMWLCFIFLRYCVIRLAYLR